MAHDHVPIEWHANGDPPCMIANYSPLLDDPNVPSIVRELRQDFDDRMMDLFKQATLLLEMEPPTASETVHVPYRSRGLHVIAVFHQPTGLFTQLIARSAQEEGLERPSYTISLFLTAFK